MLSLSLPFATGEAEAADADRFAPNAFIRIEGDGQIVLTMPYVEMGQGTYTSIPMLIAEELEVDLKQVQLEHAPPNEKLYGNPLLAGVQATGNSNAIRGGVAAPASSRRDRENHARVGGGKALECRSGVLPRAKRRSASRADRKTHQIWRTCRRCRAHACPRKRGAQAAGGFQAHRHPGQASGHTGEGQRNGRLRHRRSAAGREDRDPCAIARLRRSREERG